MFEYSIAVQSHTKRFVFHSLIGIRSSSFGEIYVQSDVNVTKLMKKIGKVLFTFVILLISGPFTNVLIDYLAGKYDISSWKLLYETT